MARPGFTNHWKFLAVVDALDLPEPYALGLIEMMWLGCYESGDDTLGGARGGGAGVPLARREGGASRQR